MGCAREADSGPLVHIMYICALSYTFETYRTFEFYSGYPMDQFVVLNKYIVTACFFLFSFDIFTSKYIMMGLEVPCLLI